MRKKELRLEYKNVRDTMSSGERKEKDIIILEQLCKMREYAEAETVFTYVNFGSEVNTIGIIKNVLAQGKRVAVPRVMKNGKIPLMKFIWIENFETLRPNNIGICEPVSGEVAVHNYNTVFIVPGLVFSETMDRIGYGGGFYDAYLSGIKAVKIGLCYEVQMKSGLIGEGFDVKMDYIVTDKRIYF